MKNLTDLLQAQSKLYQDESGKSYSFQLSDDVLSFIDTHVREGSKTLETGAGVSTVLFALKGASHVCIVPSEEEVSRIKEFCTEHSISTDKLRFEIDRSERCLPRLSRTIDGLDLVLIDGAHGFPIPFLDWYYTADRLKVGGLLIIDDIEIWTCHTLKMFLIAEPEWKIEVDHSPRSVVFRKLQAGGCGKNEWDQPYVVEQTLDLMFSIYPDCVDWIRPYVPSNLFHDRERRLTFRARNLRRGAFRTHYLVQRTASRMLPGPIKRSLKRLMGLTEASKR